jgi:3-oxoacyl-[acyl-carrier-protein] synthase-1
MSAPHPQGLGAKLAMEQALAMAGVDAGAVGYVNLHGTATPANDAAEGKAVAALFGERAVACSSTKGATGHTLGAAGGIEAVISALALRHGMAWAGVQTRQVDDSIPVDYLLDNRAGPIDLVLSNSFGFGGTNCSLLLGRAG